MDVARALRAGQDVVAKDHGLRYRQQHRRPSTGHHTAPGWEAVRRYGPAPAVAPALRPLSLVTHLRVAEVHSTTIITCISPVGGGGPGGTGLASVLRHPGGVAS